MFSSSLLRTVSTSARFPLSRMYATPCCGSHVSFIPHHLNRPGLSGGYFI